MQETMVNPAEQLVGQEVKMSSFPAIKQLEVKYIQTREIDRVLLSKAALDKLKEIKANPNHIPKEKMLRDLMMRDGITRAQAKVAFKKFETQMLKEFEQQIEEMLLSRNTDVQNVRPLVKGVFSTLGYQL